ncbi:zinc finger RNA-binding protein-like [Clytia hemisphaerica]
MANYGYGYGNYTSQPQQFSAATYGYTSQPATRVVQGYQTGTAAYGATTGYAQPAQAPVQAVPPPASSGAGGYGYFQRASDQSGGYSQKSNFSSSTGNYGTSYGSSVKPAYGGGSSQYQQKSGYSTNSSYSSGGYQQRSSTSSSYNNSAGFAKQKTTPSTTTPKTSGNHQNAYEKVVYNAATSFLSQQAGSNKKHEKPTFKLGNQKTGWGVKNAGPAKPQQLHYCEVCKISCAGPQTYKEHLEGQKHKKKAAAATTDLKKLAPGTHKCELCDVICTGKDAFNAHIKGANHLKTIKLHQKLGKPIPEIKAIETTAEPKKANVVKTMPLKMNFVGGTKLTSTGVEEKIEVKKEVTTTAAPTTTTAAAATSESTDQEVPVEGTPIGESYVEDIKSDVGKVIGFKCTLCDCRFNDHVAKMAHIKGRRHRMSYKKKVDRTIHVEMKGSKRKQAGVALTGGSGAPGTGEEGQNAFKQKQFEQMQWERQLRMREEELSRWERDEYMRRANEDRYWTRPDKSRMHEMDFYEWERRENYMEHPGPMFHRQGPPPPTPDDKLIMAKHSDIYPSDSELKQVQSTVAAVEKALKMVSDSLGDKDSTPGEIKPLIKTEVKEEKKEEEKKVEPLMKSAAAAAGNNRTLKGVMRVGPLCTGLLLKGQLAVELVVLCADKPTKTLLTKVGKLVPDKLKEAAPEAKYNMSISVADCCINITSTDEPKCTVKVTLTSPACRDEDEQGQPKESTPVVNEKDVLDKKKTLEALAALRHAKWFQARANQLTSCVITIRIVRDLCQRSAAFKPLSGWAIELLCEKAIGSSFGPIPPGEAFRRVLEAVSSGVFLPGGTGLIDPCEKEKTDAAANLTAQEREDMTAAAQQALRSFAFRQLHKVLGVEPLKPSGSRKRKAPSTSEAAAEPAKQVKVEA